MINKGPTINQVQKNSAQKSIISPIYINTYHKQGQFAKIYHQNSTASPGSSIHNSRTKLKLVSPFRQRGNVSPGVKQNTPVLCHESFHSQKSYLIKNSPQIQLGGKCSSKIRNDLSMRQQTNASSISILRPIQKYPVLNIAKSPLGNINFQKQHPNSHSNPVFRPINQHQRAISPHRVCINNKTFDIGSLKSQIVYVSPINRTLTETRQAQQFHHSSRKPIQSQQVSHKNNLPSQLVIQQEDNIQELKESYESEIKEIKQLQQEIQQNNQEIKELLNSSRASKQIHSSRLLSQEQLAVTNQQRDIKANRAQKVTYDQSIKEGKYAICSHQTLINELNNINTSQRISQDHKSEVIPAHDEVSVQTEHNDTSNISNSILNRSQSHHRKLSITRNEECQIQMHINPIEKEHSKLEHQCEFQTEFCKVQRQTSPIQQIQKIQIKKLPYQVLRLQPHIQDIDKENIPISQVNDLEQINSQSNCINPGMKKSQNENEIQTVNKTQTTHNIQVQEKPKITQQVKHITKILESQKSIISEGKSQSSTTKRRSRNNIYL